MSPISVWFPGDSHSCLHHHTLETSSLPESSIHSHCAIRPVFWDLHLQAHLDTRASKPVSTLGEPPNQDSSHFQNCLHSAEAEAVNCIAAHVEYQGELFSPIAPSLWARGSQDLCWEVDPDRSKNNPAPLPPRRWSLSLSVAPLGLTAHLPPQPQEWVVWFTCLGRAAPSSAAPPGLSGGRARRTVIALRPSADSFPGHLFPLTPCALSCYREGPVGQAPAVCIFKSVVLSHLMNKIGSS